MNDMAAAALSAEKIIEPRPIDVDVDLGAGDSDVARAMTDSNYIISIDPETIRPSSLPNRDPCSLRDSSYVDLEEDIRRRGTNVVPVELRPLPAPHVEGKKYEIVTGHKRCLSCANVGIPVRATIVHIDDEQLLLRRLSENTGRTDFSAFELGRLCQALMKERSYASNRQLALAITRDESLVSKALTIAGLPPEIINAFGSTSDIQYRHAKPLSDAFVDQPEYMLEAARALAVAKGGLKPAEVLEKLTAKPHAEATTPKGDEVGSDKPVEPFKAVSAKHEFVVDGKSVGSLSTDEKGRVKVQIKPALKPAVVEKLHAALREALEGRPRRQPKPKLPAQTASDEAAS